MSGVIYKIENKVNGKVYIGQTIRCVDRRIRVHFVKLRKNYHNNTHLQNAFNKYGEESFLTSTVESCSIEKIDERETYWIKHYKDKGICYNFESGGNVNKIASEETKLKLSESSTNMWADKDTRRKIVSAMKRGKENHNSRRVICLNDMNVFESVTDASEHYDLHMKTVYDCVTGKFNYCHSKCKGKKFAFSFYEEGKKYEWVDHVHELSRSVICITTGEVFNSITEASKKYGLETSNISKVCKGRQNSTGKLPDGTRLKWSYIENYQASN